MKEIAVFLGPSLSLSVATSILDAAYLPPAKQGDLLSYAVQFQPKTIVLIDGNFHSCLSVWHKEILYCLHLGINVIGASSMGALRAAETASFGMIGVGKIFELYKNGTVKADDEVALVHAPAEENYLPFSIPLINLRFTFDKLKAEKILSAEVCDSHFAEVQQLFYPERTYEKIKDPLVVKALQENYVDQKAQDAVEALKFAKTLSQAAPRPFPRSSLFDVLYHYERRQFHPGGSVSQSQIASYAALHHPEFSKVQFHAMNQMLASQLAKMLGIEVSDEEIRLEKERFCFRLKIQTDEQFSRWLETNHLTKEDFDALLIEKAKSRKLHNSMSSSQIQWKKAKYLLDELKWIGEYADWSALAASQEDFVVQGAPGFGQSCQEEIYSKNLIETHLKESQWSPDVPFEQWAEEAGFQGVAELRYEMMRAKIAREYLKNIF